METHHGSDTYSVTGFEAVEWTQLAQILAQ